MPSSTRLRRLLVPLAPALAALAIPAAAQATPIITSPSSGQTFTSDSVVVRFSDDEGFAGPFVCAFDGAPYEDCASGDEYINFDNGDHYLFVARKNNQESRASVDFKVAIASSAPSDTTPPETTITEGPAEGSLTNVPSQKFTFTSNEANSTFACARDGSTTFVACTPGQVFTFTGQGAHSLAVAAKDAAGNKDATPAKRSFTLDTVAPPITVTYRDLDSYNAVTDWTLQSEPGARFECSIDNGPFKPCTSPVRTSSAPGNHGFDARAVDTAGNVGSSSGYSFTTTAPPPPPPPAPPALPAKPQVTFGSIVSSLAKARSKGISVSLSTNGATTVDAQGFIAGSAAKKLGLGSRKLLIATGSGSANGAGKVVLKLTSKAKSKLKKGKRVVVTVVLDVTNAGGTTTVTKSVTLK